MRKTLMIIFFITFTLLSTLGLRAWPGSVNCAKCWLNDDTFHCVWDGTTDKRCFLYCTHGCLEVSSTCDGGT